MRKQKAAASFPDLPESAKAWLNTVFAGCNDRVSAKLTRTPSTHETSLDLTFIEHFSEFASPVRFSRNWVLQIQTHYLGGGRHFGEWEIADIGLLVIFRRAGQIVRTKACLMQSKRLYPHEGEHDEDAPIDYEVGFGRLLQPDKTYLAASQPRFQSFSELSAYEALLKGDDQYRAIASYERKFGIPVYYLMYNPLLVPWTTQTPIEDGRIQLPDRKLGIRVFPAKDVRKACAAIRKNTKPSLKLLAGTYARIGAHNAKGGWVLEDFIVELVLGCVAGYRAESPRDIGLRRIFTRRTGPIAAAIALTIDLTE